jgi:hypothetical protein
VTGNNDRRRRITTTVTTNLVAMDTVVDNKIVIITQDSIINVEVLERYFKP